MSGKQEVSKTLLHLYSDHIDFNMKDRPCTCHHVDYNLWSIKQWGEDCSYQYWAPQCDTLGIGLNMK